MLESRSPWPTEILMGTDDKILFIDLETTGTDPDTHMITQIAAEYYVGGQKQKDFFTKVKAIPQPGTAVSLEALKITKQSLQDTMTNGKDEAEALMEFVDWLLELDTSKLCICGHNVNFDINFIKALFKKYRLEQFDRVVSYRVEDTCSLARSMQKAGLLPLDAVGLGKLSSSLGISIPKGEHLHNAATDVKITAKIYYRLLDILKSLAQGEIK